jgi:hypothetical protein
VISRLAAWFITEQAGQSVEGTPPSDCMTGHFRTSARGIALLAFLGACSSSGSLAASSELGAIEDAGEGDGASSGDADASVGEEGVALGDASTTDRSPSVDAATLDDALGAMDFTIAHGVLAFPALDCCAAVTCFGNNPSSPYGELFVPRGPGQTTANPGERADGTSPIWRIREDEAIVFVGPTPPRAVYYGFTPYLFDRQSGPTRDTIFASLSDTLNLDVIHTAGGEGAPFAKETAIVITANATTRATVHAALATAGVAEGEVNDLAVPEAVVHLGLDTASDTLTVLLRVALFDSEAEKADYLAAPGGAVFRVTPRVALAAAPLSVPADRPRGTGTDEGARSADVKALHDAIVAAYPSLGRAEIAGAVLAVDPAQCIASGRGCNGDNRDALYSTMTPTPFRFMDSDQLVVYGVDHHASGKAAYSNVSVYDLANLYGVASIDSRSWPGTADDYLPGDTRAKGLFAWTVARHCPAGAMHCTEIPDGCPGVPIDHPAMIASRAYLEPSTHTGPLSSELIIDRAVLFRP